MDRNSYYKTGQDATAMTLKTDYYSGLGSNMHAAYNVQLAVADTFICTYFVSQSRTDSPDFIGIVVKLKKCIGKYPKKICADAGYGTLQNYRFLYETRIENYVKPVFWQGHMSGRRPVKFWLQDDGKLVCLNGCFGEMFIPTDRHAKKPQSLFFLFTGCAKCDWNAYCKQYQKHKDYYKITEI